MVESNKKDPFQFTIKFNENVQKHVIVANYLNALGRSKAQVIAEAVIMYMQSMKEPQKDHSILLPQPALTKEETSKEVVEESSDKDGFGDLDDMDLRAIMESMQCLDDLSDEDD